MRRIQNDVRKKKFLFACFLIFILVPTSFPETKSSIALPALVQHYTDPEDKTVNSKLDELIDDFSVTNFGGNIIKVFEYVSYNIEYAYGDNPAPAKKPSVVIQRGRGDCVNQALLLQTMLEALYLRTYGSIPEDFSYFVCGIVGLWWTESPLEEIIYEDILGGHAWVVLNTKFIPQYILDECTENFQDTLVNVPVGDVQFFEDQETSLQFVTLELEKKELEKEKEFRETIEKLYRLLKRLKKAEEDLA